MFKQILKEFWLPICIALVWSFINYTSSSEADWTVTKIINIGAPTFFFASWLTAQYFRIKKQEHVSNTLSSIETRVNEVMSRVENQANDIEEISKSSVVRGFDERIFHLREAKEELADISRALKGENEMEASSFSLHQAHPLYTVNRQLGMILGYSEYVVSTNLEQEITKERFTRVSYHVEELGGQIGNFIGRLNHIGVEWKTPRSCLLLNDICNSINSFESKYLKYSDYAAKDYKSGQDLKVVLASHVKNLKSHAA